MDNIGLILWLLLFPLVATITDWIESRIRIDNGLKPYTKLSFHINEWFKVFVYFGGAYLILTDFKILISLFNQ